VDGNIGAALDHRSLDLGHEQAGAGNGAERAPVTIPRSRHHLQLDLETGMVPGERRGNQLGLAQSKARAARGDHEVIE
jgi:hypothetical protein